MKYQDVGPMRWTVTVIGGVVTAILLFAAVMTGLRWTLKTFDQFVDSKSIIKPEHVKPMTE